MIDSSEDFFSRYQSLQSEAETRLRHVFDVERMALEEERSQFAAEREELAKRLEEVRQLKEGLEAHAANAKEKVKLNVGGKSFTTAKSTLFAQGEDTFFHRMLNGLWEPDEDGEFFIDREPRTFEVILNYFRYGRMLTAELSNTEKELLYLDLDFYGLEHMKPLLNPQHAELHWNPVCRHIKLHSANPLRVVKGATNCSSSLEEALIVQTAKPLPSTGLSVWQLKPHQPLAGCRIALGVTTNANIHYFGTVRHIWYPLESSPFGWAYHPETGFRHNSNQRFNAKCGRQLDPAQPVQFSFDPATTALTFSQGGELLHECNIGPVNAVYPAVQMCHAPVDIELCLIDPT
uniref:BTB domain-containing protein n=1 Tax=Eutreptiella gymnastica TaxID=73025 RepID=A0A7S1NLC7_9EUGL|mmetsp:Transcript_54623/g.97100  ORF Transcript_54623/g.97100 Transcript_54623/m.97100 type:complete len:347 (+) Transcript_54623:41-1081(+)